MAQAGSARTLGTSSPSTAHACDFARVDHFWAGADVLGPRRRGWRKTGAVASTSDALGLLAQLVHVRLGRVAEQGVVIVVWHTPAGQIQHKPAQSA